MSTIETTAALSQAPASLRFLASGPELGAAQAAVLVEEVLSQAETAQLAEAVLDLSSVSRMSTGALALLLLLQERLEVMGSRLRLVPPTGPARALVAFYKLEGKLGID